MFNRGNGKDYRWDPALAPRIRMLATQGKGIIEIGADIGIPSGVLAFWESRQTYPGLPELLAECRDLTASYYLNLARSGLVYNTRFGPRVDQYLLQWVAERSEPRSLRQVQEMSVRQYSASVDLGRLDPEQLARISAGEHIGAVLGSGMASQEASSEDAPSE